MHLRIDISETAEEELRKALGPDLDEAARDALLIHGYRTGRLSLGFLAEALGFTTRLDAQEWLAARNIPLNYDLEELESDRATLRQQFGVEI